jgi:hypothetical protein
MKLVALIVATGATAVLAGTGAATAATGPSCSLVSAKRVKSALRVTVGSPIATKKGPVTVCGFTGVSPILVRFQTGETAAMFSAGRKSFTTHGEPTETVGGLGDNAFSSSLAGGKSNTIVILKHTTELLVTGTEPLAKLEALAKLILPAL